MTSKSGRVVQAVSAVIAGSFRLDASARHASISQGEASGPCTVSQITGDTSLI